LNPYESLPTEQDTHEFFVRVKEKRHRFSAYAVIYLKDKRYLKIQKEISKYFVSG
jgi:hypothetical protein